jgi:hypothetical protein
MTPLPSHSEDHSWLSRLAYRTGVFSKLNDLNVKRDWNDVYSMGDKGPALHRKTIAFNDKENSETGTIPNIAGVAYCFSVTT